MKTMFQKVWEQHEVVPETADTPAVLYVDRHLIHEVTSPQAFTVLRERGLTVRRPDRTLFGVHGNGGASYAPRRVQRHQQTTMAPFKYL